MKALILVAGKAVRMGDLTKDSHKTLLPVAGKATLSWMLDALVANDIDEVVFVCGYRKEIIKDFVNKNHSHMKVSWVENSIYSETNTAYSVFLAKDEVIKGDHDILLINGDVILDSRAIKATIEASGRNVLATRFDRVDEEEVKVRLNGNKMITEIGKHLSPSESAGESVGINRLSVEILPELFDTLQNRIENGAGRSEYYEHSFDELIQKGSEFFTADVTELPVMEMDTPEDYEAVKAKVASGLEA